MEFFLEFDDGCVLMVVIFVDLILCEVCDSLVLLVSLLEDFEDQINYFMGEQDLVFVQVEDVIEMWLENFCVVLCLIGFNIEDVVVLGCDMDE